jgi:hypothetical protein
MDAQKAVLVFNAGDCVIKIKQILRNARSGFYCVSAHLRVLNVSFTGNKTISYYDNVYGLSLKNKALPFQGRASQGFQWGLPIIISLVLAQTSQLLSALLA